MSTKVCKICKESKALSQFNKNTQAADGLDHRCKVCQSKRAVEYQRKRRKDPKWKAKYARTKRAKDAAEQLIEMVRTLARSSTDITAVDEAVDLLVSITREDELTKIVSHQLRKD